MFGCTEKMKICEEKHILISDPRNLRLALLNNFQFYNFRMSKPASLSGSIRSVKGSLKDGGENDEKLEKAESGEVKLEATMTLLNACNVTVGSIIGSGIFVSPSGVLQYAGSPNWSLVIWTISGIFSLVITDMFISLKETVQNIFSQGIGQRTFNFLLLIRMNICYY